MLKLPRRSPPDDCVLPHSPGVEGAVADSETTVTEPSKVPGIVVPLGTWQAKMRNLGVPGAGV
jgi:hypothetical protein